jgi:carboxyl-terminal processing protease
MTDRPSASHEDATAPRLGLMVAAALLLALAVLAGGLAGRAGLFGPPLDGGAAIVSPRATASPSSAVPATEPAASDTPGASGESPGAPSPAPATTPPAATIGPGASVPPDAPANFGLVWEALSLVREHYVDRTALDPTRLTYGAIAGIVAALGDPNHTVFLTPEDLRSEQQSLSGELEGIGAVIGVEGGAPIIASVIRDSPAQRAGLRSGDRIIAVDGESSDALTLPELVRRIRGPAGTTVTLTIIPRDSASPTDVDIVRERITVPAVVWAPLPGRPDIAVIRLVQFSEGTSDQFRTALAEAREGGATQLVLDLRSNPGGLVHEAVGVASQLMDAGDVYVRQTADGQQIPVPVSGDATAADIPLVVLVDFGSASSAEILAGAIQDNDRGPVIGTRTFGTGTVLNTFPLSDGSALRIGVEQWLTPSGQGIFPNGITPDEAVEIEGDARPLDPDELRDLSSAELEESGDSQLLHAIELLEGTGAR